jgi:UDP:flavonoid glycosyltransferase YjiC (YdhE family)
MASIVLTCWGSHGDLDPYLGLGLELKRRGHRVTLVTLDFYRELVVSSGLGFSPLRPAVDPTDTALIRRILDRNTGTEFLLREVMYPAIEAIYEDLHQGTGGADLLISHPLSFAAPIVAEIRKLRWASTVLAPLSFFSADDPPVFPNAPWLKSLDRLGRWPARALVALAKRATMRWQRPVADLRQRLGLSPGGNPIFEGQHSPHLVLALFSRVLAAPRRDWPENVVVTGNVFHDAPHGNQLPASLDRFLADGPPPIVFTLGTSVVLIADRFWAESMDAVKRLDARAVFLAGPEESVTLNRLLPPTMIAVDRAPHSLLFPRASAVVQQCGIGTLAQSLRSGRPMLAVPYAHDQPDNAWRAAQLGITKTIYPRRYRGATVAGALRELLSNPSYADAAARVASEVRSESGAIGACDAIERTFSL